jgi:hypothetical protein
LPTVEMCREEVERAVRIAKHWMGTHGEPFLIAPTERLVQLSPEKQWRLKYGQPVLIPHIACLARFGSADPARDPNQDYSALVLVWFQDEFALPIDPGVVERIRAVDWNAHATDYLS